MQNVLGNNKKYKQGVYIPKNKDKVVKLNGQGGVVYRSSWEQTVMIWLDNREDITRWGAECVSIPYQKTHFDGGDTKIKVHTYYSDFYYEQLRKDGTKKRVVVEVKPMKDYKMVLALQAGKLEVPDSGNAKKLKNFEYDLKMAYTNQQKWNTMIAFCEKKGFDFIIITEDHLKGFTR
jgi:hypothetical protein